MTFRALVFTAACAALLAERIRSCAALRRAQQGKLVEWLGQAR